MKNILIVDDDSINCIMTKNALCDNYKVAAVHSGKEALEYLEMEIPDLILLDIEMSGLSGKQLAGLLKENKNWMDIPLIFLTSDSNPETEVKCLTWGADDFIKKPIVPIVMNTRISRIMELHELRKGLLDTANKNEYQQGGRHGEHTEATRTVVDLENIHHIMKRDEGDKRNESKGAFHLAYDEFKNIYDFVSRCVARNEQEVQIVLFTLSLKDTQQQNVTLEQVMPLWEKAVIASLRAMDTGTRYSNSQYIVILMDTDNDSGREVAERVISSFTKSNPEIAAEITVSFGVQTMEPNN